MPRSPLQIIVIPFRFSSNGEPEFAIFHRANSEMLQFIAGGAEDDETPIDAAIREAFEEAGISQSMPLLKLDSIASVPRKAFPNNPHWPKSLFVVPEHCFAVNVSNIQLKLSNEHASFQWLPYEIVFSMLTWDSNKTALWELNERLNQL